MRKAQEFLRLIVAAVSLTTAQAIAGEAADIDKWIEQLGSEDFDTREKATTELGKRAEKIWDRLEKLSNGDNTDVRTLARRAMCEAGKRALVPVIAEAKAKVKASEDAIKEREVLVIKMMADVTDAESATAKLEAQLKDRNTKELTDADKAVVKVRDNAIERYHVAKEAYEKERSLWRKEHAKLQSRLDQLKQLQASSELILPADAPKWGPEKLAFKQRLDVAVSFEFVDAAANDAAALISKLSGLKIHFSAAAKELESTQITLRVSDLSAGLAISWLCRLAELEMKIDHDKQIIRLLTTAEVEKQVKADAE